MVQDSFYMCTDQDAVDTVLEQINENGINIKAPPKIVQKE